MAVIVRKGREVGPKHLPPSRLVILAEYVPPITFAYAIILS